jgi:hypothetical protein
LAAGLRGKSKGIEGKDAALKGRRYKGNSGKSGSFAALPSKLGTGGMTDMREKRRV